MPKSDKKNEPRKTERPVRKTAAQAARRAAVAEPMKTETVAAAATPDAADGITLRSARRFWLLAMAGLLLILGLVQWYGYSTGWGNPERVVQRRFNNAQRLTLAHRTDAAVREYQKILDVKTGDDNRRQAMIGIADLLREKKDWNRAVELYQQLRGQDPNNVLSAWAGLQIGDIQLEAGKPEEASKIYAEISRLFPKSDWDAEARLGLGKVLEKEERFKEAIAAYDALVKEYGGGFLAAEAMVRIGRCYEALDDLASARRAYRTILNKYPASTWDEAKERLRRLDAGQAGEGIRVWGQGQ